MSRYRITTWDANSLRRLSCVEISTRQAAFRAYEMAVYNAQRIEEEAQELEASRPDMYQA